MQSHGPLRVACFDEPMFGENGYLLWTDDGPNAWIIDPGLPPQPARLIATASDHDLQVEQIVLTHCHADHIVGIPALRGALGPLPVVAPRAEAHMLTDADANLSAGMGFPVTVPAADRLISPGDTLTLGTLQFDVLDVAGHSPGGLAFYCEAAGVVFGGDALFADSIGRIDLPGGSGRRLLENIRANLLSLPDATLVYSGHGPPTTIGRERHHNPYLRMDPRQLAELDA